MRLGGEAQYVVEVETLADVREAYEFAKSKGLPIFVLGGGANTIGRDEGFSGVIILNRLRGIEVVEETAEDVIVRGMGGENWDGFVRFCTERGYSGIETLAAIPGTVGAAPVQNIGAYGQEISQTIDSVSAYDPVEDELVVFGRDEMKFGYRSSIFNTGPDAGRYFITAVTLRLDNEGTLEPPFYRSLQAYLDENEISDYSPESIRMAVTAVREAKLPDPSVEASAGSFFKNVYLDAEEAEEAQARGLRVYEKSRGRFMVNSGALIEKAGLSGKELYGFRVSEKASLILINDSAKTYEALAKARGEIVETVYQKFGYRLEQEPVEVVARGSQESGFSEGADSGEGADFNGEKA